MIGVNELKLFVDYISNKDQSGNSYTPDQFNLLLRRAIAAVYTKYYGLAEKYQPGRPVPEVAYEVTQLVKDYLKNFLEIVNIVITNGLGPLPIDYNHYTSITYYLIENSDCGDAPTKTSRPVDVIDDDKWAGRKSHTIRGGNIMYPACNFNKDTIELDPSAILSVEMKYLRNPEEPKWAYTTTADDDIIYDPSNSIDVELPEMLTNEMAATILKYVGINLRDEAIQAYADAMKGRGE